MYLHNTSCGVVGNPILNLIFYKCCFPAGRIRRAEPGHQEHSRRGGGDRGAGRAGHAARVHAGAARHTPAARPAARGHCGARARRGRRQGRAQADPLRARVRGESLHYVLQHQRGHRLV